jgi:hypothetical protein
MTDNKLIINIGNITHREIIVIIKRAIFAVAYYRLSQLLLQKVGPKIGLGGINFSWNFFSK